jgi:hypothetical protein
MREGQPAAVSADGRPWSDVEDAHPAGADEKTDDDQDDAPEQLAADDREDAGHHEDDGEDPQEGCHGRGVSVKVLCGIDAFE